MAYTYLIGWSNLKRYYYGVRYSAKCKPDDLWVKYFTSSKVVKKYRKEFGEPDIIQVRRVFDNKVKAMVWEAKVIDKIGAADRDDFFKSNKPA